MSFLLPLGELVLEGLEAGVASNMGKEIYNSFAPKIRDASADLLGKQIAGYAHENPNGFVAETLNKTYQYAKRPITNNSQHSHRHNRKGTRRHR
jgi:hypothetical protein